jgi:hypothetical protein
MTRLRLAGLVAAASFALPLAAAASDQDDALKLAARIASRGGFTEAVVTLHAVPNDLPASIPLPKATLLGSVVESPRRGWMTGGGTATAGTTTASGTTFNVVHPATLYFDAPAGRDAVVAAYEAALSQAGWKPAPDIRRRMGMPQGGFSLPFPQYKLWCSPAEPRTALGILNADDATGFDLSIASSDRGTAFQCSDAPSPFDEVMRRSPLPTFTAPTGVTITASGPASDGTTTAARLESKLGLTAVFGAFAKQLTDAGWTPSGTAASASAPATRAQTFAKTVDGTPYVTLLAIYALDATHYVALADVSDVK